MSPIGVSSACICAEPSRPSPHLNPTPIWAAPRCLSAAIASDQNGGRTAGDNGRPVDRPEVRGVPAETTNKTAASVVSAPDCGRAGPNSPQASTQRDTGAVE
ncbi:hypothetical protein AAFF_G00004390 [Aldrovandia affinis]|uniref:Uncharacterized protein n=1 Tax=Aldrovandia affinis TaxID=143900 RepID=A0AAD7TDE4_9TELE|nr:hypothetical protein AAFF_G00004390 [Aldrovandia affinis]